MSADTKALAESVAIYAGQLGIFGMLFKRHARQAWSASLPSHARLVCNTIICHQRDPLPWLHVLLDSNVSPALLVECLISSGKWGSADHLVRSLEQGSRGLWEGWDAMGRGYLKKASDVPKSWAAIDGGGPGPLWHAVIGCVQRGGRAPSKSVSAEAEPCGRVFTFCFSKGACEEALEVAEAATDVFFSGADRASALSKLADEHRSNGNISKEQRCVRKAQVAQGHHA